jgi:hypothetical protein
MGGGVQDWEPQGYTPGQKAARAVGQAAQGVNDAFLPTVIGAPVDAVAWGLRKAGLPVNNPVGGSESIKRGIDYVATLPGRVGDAVTQGSVAPLTEDRTSRFEPIGPVEKAARLGGEGVGNALAVALPAGVVGNSLKAGTVGQGVANTLASQPVMQAVASGAGGAVTGATDNPWLGLGTSVAVPLVAAGARGLISPTTNRLNEQEQRLVAAAQKEGIPLTPAQLTGSPTLKTVEGTMNSLPLASGPMQAKFTEQRQAFNKAVLARAGIDANEASPATLEKAFQSAGQTFDDLASRTTINADAKLAQDVDKVAYKYGRRLESNVAPVFKSYVDDLEPLLNDLRNGATDRQIPGDVYATVRSDLGATIRNSGKNPDLKNALMGLQNALDDAVERSTSGALSKEWADARRQYQALMTIDKAMQGGTQTDRALANIPFSGLKGAVAQGDRAGFSRGRGQLNELSRVGDYLSNKIPDSGTVPRAVVANALTGGALFGGGIASGAGIPAALAGAASPYLISKFYNSPAGQAYLTNQLAGKTDFNALYGSLATQKALEEGRNALSPRGAPQ